MEVESVVNLNEIVLGRFLSQIDNVSDVFDSNKMPISEADAIKIGRIFRKLSLENTPLMEHSKRVSDKDFGEAISKLLIFLVALNNNGKLPQAKNPTADFELNQELSEAQIAEKINQLLQTYAMNKTSLFGILPLGVYMNIFSWHPLTPKLDDQKLGIIEENREALYNVFSRLSFLDSIDQTEDAFTAFQQKAVDDILHLRVLGNNHILLRTQFDTLRTFLRNHLVELRDRKIQVELLGKTGINNSFSEDDKSEIAFMYEMAEEYLTEFSPIKVITIPTKGSFVNTTQTIQTVDSRVDTKAKENDVVIYFGCANALNRQFLDIAKYNREQGQFSNSFFTACGGYEVAERDLRSFAELHIEREAKFKVAAKKFIRLKEANLCTELAKGYYTSCQIERVKAQQESKKDPVSTSF
ncbi:MAG: hypothetical protein PHY80_00275 [Rickettsiales bacterium]|nr:hypothetical protein [Rickettsiales bacterium]